MFQDNKMSNIVLTKANIVPGTNNSKMTFIFNNGKVDLSKYEVALVSLQMFYSWESISSAYGNNSFSYTWSDGVVYDVTIADGTYSVSDINSYLQNVMIQNKHYLTDTANGTNIYFLEFLTNPTLYKVQFNSYPIPTTLPVGFLLPAGATWTLPVAARTPLLMLSGNFRYIVGLNAGTYPTAYQTSIFSKLSDITPQVAPISSILIRSDLINSAFYNPSDVFYSFSSKGVPYGGIIEEKPPQYSYMKITKSSTDRFSVYFTDENFSSVKFLDDHITLILNIREIENTQG